MADRAAATCQRWEPTSFRKRAGEGFRKGRSQSPLACVRRTRNSNLWWLCRHSSPPSAGNYKAGAIPQSAYRLTAPLRRKPFGGTPCKASPERGGARCRRRAEGFTPYATKAAGGAVSRRDHNQAYRRDTHLSGGTKQEKRRTPNATCSSGEGSGGEALLSEKRPLPQNLPHTSPLREGARGRGFLQRSLLPRNHHQ